MEGKKIYQAITNVMKDIGAVSKDSTNGVDGYRYRGIDAVMNALSPALIKNGVVVIPQVLEMKREERVKKDGGGLLYSVVKVKYTFYAEDGSFVDTVVIGEGMDEKGVEKNTGHVLVEVSPDFYRPTDVVNLWGDPSKARKELGWNPTKTSFEELVRIMVEHDMKKVEKE